jgi:hypothetical protein
VEEDEDEDPEESKAAGTTTTRRQHVCLYKACSHSQTGTISKGGARETVGWFVTANRYEFEDERVCIK